MNSNQYRLIFLKARFSDSYCIFLFFSCSRSLPFCPCYVPVVLFFRVSTTGTYHGYVHGSIWIQVMGYGTPHLVQFLCSRIGGSKKAISDRRPNRAFLLRSRKSVFDPNFFDRAMRSAHPVEKVGILRGCADRIARSKKFLKPTASLTTPQTTRSHPTTATMLA